MTLVHPLTGAKPATPWLVRVGGTTGNVGTFGWTRSRWDVMTQRNEPKFHRGVDWLVAAGQPVFACFETVVERDGEQAGGKGYGLRLYIREAHGEARAIYGHLSVQFVRKGDFVRQGHCLGLTGRSGNLADDIPDHLHFELRGGYDKATAINPEYALNGIGAEDGVSKPISEV